MQTPSQRRRSSADASGKRSSRAVTCVNRDGQVAHNSGSKNYTKVNQPPYAFVHHNGSVPYAANIKPELQPTTYLSEAQELVHARAEVAERAVQVPHLEHMEARGHAVRG